jgi:hypothetical protein
MSANWWIALGVVLVLVPALVAAGFRLRRWLRETSLADARKDFHVRREYLEAKFFELASSSGKPRGLEWVGIEFDDDVAYARDRQSSELVALVAVTIRFEAIEGGGMEEVEAVGNLRAATAVFHRRDRCWDTGGRVLFNLNPDEAIHHFRSKMEILAHDPARV